MSVSAFLEENIEGANWLNIVFLLLKLAEDGILLALSNLLSERARFALGSRPLRYAYP